MRSRTAETVFGQVTDVEALLVGTSPDDDEYMGSELVRALEERVART